MADLGPQPDPGRIRQSFSQLAEEVGKLPNLPAFSNGNAILRSLHQINQSLDGFKRRFDQLDQRLDQIDTKTNHIQAQLTVLDQNNAARVQNAYLTRPSDRLAPLANPRTGAPIEEFPQTSQDLTSLQPNALQSLLRDLNLSTTGRREEKIARLRQYVGLRKVAEVA
ncbi:uncharacterized protein A1O9_13080 [Exophiala aquamarina CBS 119918]|uniref:SAP domain-containing protein n=1 Tax=Exophiala aquamarina CBS 119918 TaxID=1182545 RepID=A0A072NV07_9EURO|nr:uncharacterized protein A1O9_13080 [Exophiala aquamarina CBS 119918]KEF50868.1 hypothetical protein A1O9_13080 [Exophiala aquamarina CBS 119918]